MKTNNGCREALECIANNLENRLFGRYPSSATDEWMWKKAKAALAEPMKNCEVGTAEEQRDRFDSYCTKIPMCERCVKCRGTDEVIGDEYTHEECVLAWEQMPYEKGS